MPQIRKNTLQDAKSYGIIIWLITAQKMQRYRSGHNGADSKSVCEQSHKGSNPFLSAKARLSRSKSRKEILAAFVFENMEGGTYELFKL